MTSEWCLVITSDALRTELHQWNYKFEITRLCAMFGQTPRTTLQLMSANRSPIDVRKTNSDRGRFCTGYLTYSLSPMHIIICLGTYIVSIFFSSRLVWTGCESSVALLVRLILQRPRSYFFRKNVSSISSNYTSKQVLYTTILLFVCTSGLLCYWIIIFFRKFDSHSDRLFYAHVTRAKDRFSQTIYSLFY